MNFHRLLCPECTVGALGATSKKRALEMAAQVLAAHHGDLDADTIFDALMARERLGSTAVGEGVAIPHCRLGTCIAPVAALLRLPAPVDFDSPDRRDVDLLFVLVVPEEANDTHLALLASAAGAFSQTSYRQTLRDAGSDIDLFEAALYSEYSAGAMASTGAATG